jgi:hypothetical protein
MMRFLHKYRYQIFLFLTLVMLAIEFLIPARGRRSAEWKGRFE